VMLASGAGSFLAACGSKSGNGGGGGAAGGIVTVLAWQGYQGKGVIDAWRKQAGIQIRENPLTTNEEVLSRLKAGMLGKVDLASPNVAYVPQLIDAGLLQPIDYSRLPSMNLLPALDKTARAQTEVNGAVYAVPYMWGNDGMVYNAAAIPKAPQSWMDVFDPKYKNKVMMITGPFPNFEIWPRLIGYEPSTLTHDQLDKTVEFLINLKRTQVRTIVGDQADMADLLARGDVWVTGSGCWVGLPSIAPQGDPLAFTIPEKGGGTTWIDTWVIPKDAPNLDATYKLLDHLMSAEVQAKQADTMMMATSNADAVKMVSKQNRATYGYNEIGSEKAPLFAFPPKGGDYTTPEDWNLAWERINAA